MNEDKHMTTLIEEIRPSVRWLSVARTILDRSRHGAGRTSRRSSRRRRISSDPARAAKGPSGHAGGTRLRRRRRTVREGTRE